MKTVYQLILFTFICTAANANLYKADKMFERWEYSRAVRIYEKHAVRHPVPETYYKIGQCYQKMNRYQQAEENYRKVAESGTYQDAQFYLHYGEILQNNGKYDEAKKAFEQYNSMMPGNSLGMFHMESIDIVTEDHKYDEPIDMNNVFSVNTEHSDFCPVIYRDGIVFASSRTNARHTAIYPWNGKPYLDLYYSAKNSTGDFSGAESFDDKINQKYHDGPATFSADFKTMYFTRVEKSLKNKDRKNGYNIEQCKIYKSVYKDSSWSDPEDFRWNSNAYSVANPVLSRDGNKLYFVSDMEGGYGETDIWYVEKQQDGEWGLPKNMGSNINTFNTEKFPSEDSVGNFYFASDGYKGFGGLDICVARNEGGKLSQAIPMKYPFNSTTDDFGIVFLKDQREGYISSNRVNGGAGDDDIYYFNLDNDNVDSTLVTSIYTIGYRRPVTPVATLDVNPPDLLPKEYIGKIYFDFDKSDLRPESKRQLDSVVTYMNSNPNKRLILGGHADIRGSAEYNMKLSIRRNDAAIGYVTSKGIPRSRISATGYGFTRLVNHCTKDVICPEDQHQLNRRVEFKFE
jgi:tetratricopeptide (TPR) repeat protein